LGDAWKIEKEVPEWADDKGTSLFVIRSAKGRKLLKEISQSFVYKSVNYELWARLNPSMIQSTSYQGIRKRFFAQFEEKSDKEFWDCMKKMPFKKKCRYYAKQILKHTGLEKIARKYF
jgi:hypothetical protein